MVVLDWRRGRLFGVNILDLLVLFGLVGLTYFSVNRERYFESMKGDVEGISGDYFALASKGYGLNVVIKGEGNGASGRVVDAEKGRLYVFDGKKVLTVCSGRELCDVVPLVIRAYAVPEKRSVTWIGNASLDGLSGLPAGTFLAFSVYIADYSGSPLALRDSLDRGLSGSVELSEFKGSVKLAFRDVLPSDLPAIAGMLPPGFSLSPVTAVSVA